MARRRVPRCPLPLVNAPFFSPLHGWLLAGPLLRQSTQTQTGTEHRCFKWYGRQVHNALGKEARDRTYPSKRRHVRRVRDRTYTGHDGTMRTVNTHLNTSTCQRRSCETRRQRSTSFPTASSGKLVASCRVAARWDSTRDRRCPRRTRDSGLSRGVTATRSTCQLTKDSGRLMLALGVAHRHGSRQVARCIVCATQGTRTYRNYI